MASLPSTTTRAERSTEIAPRTASKLKIVGLAGGLRRSEGQNYLRSPALTAIGQVLVDHPSLGCFVKLRSQGFQFALGLGLVTRSHCSQETLLSALQNGQNAFVSQGASLGLPCSFSRRSRICHNSGFGQSAETITSSRRVNQGGQDFRAN